MAKEGGAERFLRAAAELGIDVEPVTYPDGTRTAADAATAIGCELSQIAKSLLVMTDTGPVLALTAGHNRLDLDALAARLERGARRGRLAGGAALHSRGHDPGAGLRGPRVGAGGARDPGD
ncbi:MAG: YbaK/EbsC family protein, partial [Acidimicrobiales bacterium]